MWYYTRAVRACYRAYGASGTTLRYALGQGAVRVGAFLCYRLDRRLRPGLKRAKVVRPLFIIGNPRSGTTLLHKLLLGTDEMVSFPTWQLYWPAITGRRVGRRVIDRLVRRGRGEVLPDWTGHRIALGEPDEEELLFSLIYDTQFKTTAMLGLDDDVYPELEFPDLLPEADRKRSMDWLDGCFRRQILDTGRTQIVAQMHFCTMRVRTMLDYYPDAKFVYLVRDPLSTVRSYLSLTLNAIEARWGLDRLEPARIERLKERRYRSTLALYRYFHDLHQAGALPEDAVMVLRYDDMVGDLRGAMDRLRDWSGLAFSAELEAHIDRKAAAQGNYRRKHRVRTLEELGLDRDRVLRDFAFVYETYGLAPAG